MRFPFVRTGRSDLFVRKWYASVLRTVRTGSGQTGPAQGVGPISSHAPARVQRQMRGNFVAAGEKRGVSFGVPRKIQRWQNQTMTSLVSIYLGIVLPTFFLVNSELLSKVIVKFLKGKHVYNYRTWRRRNKIDNVVVEDHETSYFLAQGK